MTAPAETLHAYADTKPPTIAAILRAMADAQATQDEAAS